VAETKPFVCVAVPKQYTHPQLINIPIYAFSFRQFYSSPVVPLFVSFALLISS